MARITFEATVTQPDGPGGGTFVVVSGDVRAVFGRARPAVVATINGHPWRTTVTVYGGAAYLGIAREHREAAGVAAGDRMTVGVERDDAPRVVEVPDDLAAAAAADPAVAARFGAMPYTHRLEYVRWIEEAKRPETRSRWIASAVERIRDSRPAG